MTVVVAALYVERNGAYYDLAGVDQWDEERDARTYPGPHPVVAHPPCNRWSKMATCRNQRDGNDGGCFAAALDAVHRWGGVLEHPAHSLAWQVFGLPRPASAGWTPSLTAPGLSCEVDQRHYGHRVRKPTWLYYVGPEPPVLTWGPHPSKGEPSPRGGRNGCGYLTVESIHSTRSKTPPAFRDLLVELARAASKVAA